MGCYLVTSSAPQVRKKHQYHMRGKPEVKTRQTPSCWFGGRRGHRWGQDACSVYSSVWVAFKNIPQTLVSKQFSDSLTRPLTQRLSSGHSQRGHGTMTSHPQQKMGQLPECRRKWDITPSHVLIIDLVWGKALLEFVLHVINDCIIEKLVDYAAFCQYVTLVSL